MPSQVPFLAGDQDFYSLPATNVQAQVLMDPGADQSVIIDTLVAGSQGSIAAGTFVEIGIAPTGTAINGVFTRVWATYNLNWELGGQLAFARGKAVRVQFNQAGGAGTYESISIGAYFE